MVRNIGGAGEARFEELCCQAGLSAHRSSDDDRYGWDFLVEFPLSENAKRPIDEQPSPIECKVQVKATETGKKSWQIKVSVLYRLVKTPLPAFIALLDYTQSFDPKAVYLVHIDENMMSKVLKRVRELDEKGKGSKLYEHTMTVKFQEMNKLENSTENSLREAILYHIPEGMPSYTRKKQQMLEDLGYEEDSHTFNVTFSSKGDVREELTELFIGLRNELEFSDLKVFNERFGIKLPDHTISVQMGTMRLPDLKPSIKGQVYFKKNEYDPPVEFDADIFLPDPSFVKANENMKFRIVTEYFELICSGKKSDFKCRWNDDTEMPIEMLRNHIWLFEKINTSDGLLFGIVNNESAYSLGRLNYPEKLELDFSEIAPLLDSAITICNRNKVNLNRTNVSISTIYVARKGIEFLSQLYAVHPKDIKLKSSIDGDLDKEFAKTAFVFTTKVRIGNIALAIVGAFKVLEEGEVFEDERVMICEPAEVEIGETRFGSVEEISDLDMQELIKPYWDKLEKGGFIVYKV